jgi:CheY-like chemotaxis protein
MIDNLISLRLLVVSGSAVGRELWRAGVAMASLPVELFESADAVAARDLLRGDPVDIVLVDAGLPDVGDVVALARASAPPPVVLSIMPAGEHACDGLNISGGTIAGPLNAEHARVLVNRCIRARVPTRVMIVDDSGVMRTIVRKILDASQFRLDISEAREGTDALAKISSGAVDMVLLDYNMPGLNGLETLIEIKRETPSVAVVMMSSTFDPAVSARAGDVGAAGFLKKPFFPKDVDEVLERHYGLRAPL